ncbi:MAG: DUF2752 domain-containing protein [Balneolaceae bacterium]
MKFFKTHFEWMAFLTGLILMASMSPSDTGLSFCLFERLGVSFCPGEGLGHSISYLFRGEFNEALQANLMGPFAVLILGLRIGSIWKDIYKEQRKDLKEY